MVEKLCTMYGPVLGTKNGHTFHAFPEIKKLANPSVEQDLRKAGFGYRAKFIQKSAALIQSFGGPSWLQSLQTKPYQEAKKALMELPGVGAKVRNKYVSSSLILKSFWKEKRDHGLISRLLLILRFQLFV